MNLLKKSLFILVSCMCAVLMFGCDLGFIGKTSSPTEVVCNSLDSIKTGDSDDFLNNINNGVITFKKNTFLKDTFPDSSGKMKGLLNNITYKVNSETINGKEAVVNVTLNGPELNGVLDKLMQNIIGDLKSGAISLDNFDFEQIGATYDENFSKLLDNVKTSDRTMDVKLEKEMGKWKIKDKNDICKLASNIDKDEFEDKYDETFKNIFVK